MSIQAIILDFGGVLVRLEDPRGQREWEARLGLEPGAFFDLVFGSEISARAMVGEISEAELWQHLADRLGLEVADLQNLQRDFWSGERLNVELVRFIRTLRPHYKTAILSNAWSDAREALLHFGLDCEVDTLIISAEEGLAKPDPRIYTLAAERLGVQPEQAVFLDDLIENVEGARAVGMRAVHYQDNAQAIAEVKGHL